MKNALLIYKTSFVLPKISIFAALDILTSRLYILNFMLQLIYINSFTKLKYNENMTLISTNLKLAIASNEIC